MNKLILDHTFTPRSLKKLNDLIVELLSNQSFDETELLLLIEKRDSLISEYLISCEPDIQKAFAGAELEVNKRLVAYVKDLSKKSLKQITDFVRGRSAVKKYR